MAESLLHTTLTDYDIKLEMPLRMQITGPTDFGKSRFCLNLVKFRHLVFQEKFSRIVYCYNWRQDVDKFLDELRQACPTVELVIGLPDAEIYKDGTHTLVSLVKYYSQLRHASRVYLLSAHY